MDERILAIAAEHLGVSKEDLEVNSRSVPELDAYVFWVPTRGGGSVIVDSNYEKLELASGYGFDQLVQAFREGRRS